MASLYRSCLRAVRRLPDEYLRQFFTLKFSDDIRALRRTTNANGLLDRKIRRIQRERRKIDEALNGDVHAFAHVLDVAYGRKGKLQRELLQPLLTDPTRPLPSPIIPGVEKSRPPVYSAELTALLTSGISRPGKGLNSKHLKSPPTLPARADSSSDEARLLGPFSKRREVNIRWRYFTQESSKLWPPLQVDVKDMGSNKEDAMKAGIRHFGFQGLGLQQHIQNMAGPIHKPVPLTRKERAAGVPEVQSISIHPSRWLRRRYRQLLGRLPILTYHLPGKGRARYEVSWPPSALTPSLTWSPSQLVETDDVNLAWLDLAEKSS